MPLTAVTPDEFARRLDVLGPFEPAPLLAIAASGGADSTALALLARDWVRSRHGRVVAFIVDHGLRPASGAEAGLARMRLEDAGIASGVLPVRGLAAGPALAARARRARYAALTEACRTLGCLHLLLAHHAGDQAETLVIRRRAGSGAAGMAGMAALRETHDVRLLRPLLDLPKRRLVATVEAAGMDWIEDPSNRDPAATRSRVRLELAAAAHPNAAGPATAAGTARAAGEAAAARELAERVSFYPEAFAVIRGDRLSAGALGRVVAAVSGRDFPISPRDLRGLGEALRPATIAGAEIRRAGRLAPGAWLVLREGAAIGTEVPAETGAVWDSRFRLCGAHASATLGALGAQAARVRTGLPPRILRATPALRVGGQPDAVPAAGRAGQGAAVWAPPEPAAGAPFAPASRGCYAQG